MKRFQVPLIMALCCLHMVRTSASTSRCLRVGSFNVQWFTPSKSTNDAVMAVLADIIQRYDVMLMMEIRGDVSHAAMTRLWSLVNATSPFGLSLSEPLGRSRYTEHYGFFYRLGKAFLADTYQYNDSINDVFEREPFAVLIKTSRRSSKPGTAFIGAHIQPTSVVAEMGHMVNVTKTILRHWNTDRAVIMGDLNADCRYMSSSARARTPLRTTPGFTWLITDTADSTVSDSTNCAYDRIIVTDTVTHRDASVFDFQQSYSLSAAEALAVSDHFPVEATIC